MICNLRAAILLFLLLLFLGSFMSLLNLRLIDLLSFNHCDHRNGFGIAMSQSQLRVSDYD